MFKTLDKQPTTLVPLLLLFMSAGPLVGAYLSQYGFGYEPCELCLYQRVPYWIIVALSIMALVLPDKHCNMARFLFLCAIAFLVDAGIAGYHTGVEQRWWEGLEGCTDDIVATTIESLKAALMDTPVARCDEPALSFLGLSMAAWNTIYAAGATIFTFMLFGRYSKD